MTQTTFTDDVLIEGSQDIEQLQVRGDTTQTKALQTWENSAGDPLAQVTGDGRLIVGEPDGTANSLVEAHQFEDSPTKPNRGFHSTGQVSDPTYPLDTPVEWIVEELELRGDTDIAALHTALRVRASNLNTGTPTTNAELRGADIEVINTADAGDDPLAKVTGLQVAVTNAAGKEITDAIGLKVKITKGDDGGIAHPFAIYTEGPGATHLDDYLELRTRADTPPVPPNDFVQIYPKSDGKLYTQTWNTPEARVGSGLLADGGTGADLSATGPGVVVQASAGAPLSVGAITSSAVSDFSEAVDDRVNALLSTDDSLSKSYDDASNTMTLYSVVANFNARLTLTSGNPADMNSVTGATQVFLTPYMGNQVTVWDGTRVRGYTLSSEISIKLTDTQSGSLTNGSTTISGLTDTSQLVVGMKVTGTGVGANAVISSITNGTTIVVSVASTSTGTQSLTFKCPVNTLYDIFVYVNGGSLKLGLVAWNSNLIARVTSLNSPDGYLALSSNRAWRYCGSVQTSADGQTEKSHGVNNNNSTSTATGGKCYLVNYYNRLNWAINFFDFSGHAWTGSAYRLWNNNPAAFIGFVSCMADEDVYGFVQGYLSFAGAGSGGMELAFNGVQNIVGDPFHFLSWSPASAASHIAGGSKTVTPRLGFNAGYAYEYGAGAVTQQQAHYGYLIKA